MPPKLAARFAPIVMPFFLSVLMTSIVSFISTVKGVGVVPNLVQLWLSAWAVSWLIAFPTMLVVMPFVKKLTAAVVDVPK